MGAKPAILLAGAITLIALGPIFWRAPMLESATEEHRAFVPPRNRMRSHLPEDSGRQGALVGIAFEAARVEPIKALALALELNADPERDELIRHATAEWAATAPEAATEWARQIEAPSLRVRTLASVATAWAEMDPRAAAALAIRELEPGRLQEDTIVSIVQRWGQREPLEAAAWISTFEDNDLRVAAVHNLVKLWADQNPSEAGEWLKALQPGSIRDVGIAAYVEQIAPAFPEQASQWANFAHP